MCVCLSVCIATPNLARNSSFSVVCWLWFAFFFWRTHCARTNHCCFGRYYSSRFTDVVCRLNVFPADMALKDEQRQLSTLQQRAFAFDRNHPFTASLSPYFQLLRQRLAVKLQQRRRAAAAMKCVMLMLGCVLMLLMYVQNGICSFNIFAGVLN